jgi:2,5-dioxopentanoate dehydrogenase
MFSGHNHIGFTTSAEGDQKINVFSTLQQNFLPEEFTLATDSEIEEALAKAKAAFNSYKKTSTEARAVFLETIAEEIISIGDALIQRAMLESGLLEARLVGERGRTVNQLKLFASLLREGSWVEAVIDPAQPDRKPLPRADLRKMLFPIGPVVVFGASNFPFAFSTAGGDTASALAAGCPVIVKAHNSHLGTNELVANAITAAAIKCGMPDGVFSSLIGEGSKLGQTLAKHPEVKAIGFTGSYKAGMALYNTAVNDRETPIPVYAEMSSINPVLVLPGKVKEDSDKIATQLAGSITLGVGQFCTNPGLLFVIDSDETKYFIQKLGSQLAAVPEAVMLNKTICQSYYEERKKLADQRGVKSLHFGNDKSGSFKGSPALLEVNANDFIANAELQNEVFGPASLVVICNNESELFEAIQSLHGQLTGTVFSTANDITTYTETIDALTEKVGRVIYNSVPTGVEVCHAMVHGGPFPATTDGRTTSVGTEAIKRFIRPVCYQDCPEEALPDALKDANPLGIMRKVDGRYTREAIQQMEEV